MPAHANDINLRALAQSSSYLGAQAKAHETKEIVRGDMEQAKVVSVQQALDAFEYRITSEEEDLIAAGILNSVAKEQHPTSIAMDTDAIPVNSSGGSGRCPIITCEYHNKGFSLEADRDKHTASHFEGDFRCSFYSCPLSRKVFSNVQDLKMHINHNHCQPAHDFICRVCFGYFTQPDYLGHLEDCVVHIVETRGFGKGLTMSSTILPALS